MEMQGTPGCLMTGHPQIDSQHLKLEELIQQLSAICEAKDKSGSRCSDCPADRPIACTSRLDGFLGDLLGFAMTHFAYEEKLMCQLPATQACRQHIDEHQQAHAAVSDQLADLTRISDVDDPNRRALRLQKVVSTWMGVHMLSHDVQLAGKLQGAIDMELNCDVRLAALLGKDAG